MRLQEARWAVAFVGVLVLVLPGRGTRIVTAEERPPSRCNILVDVSQELLTAGLGQATNRTDAIYDCILSTPIRGTSCSVGRVRIELQCCSEQGVADIVAEGTTQSCSTSFGRRIQVHGRSTTPYQARKRLTVDADGIHASPAGSSARVHSTLVDVTTDYHCAAVDRVVREITIRRSERNRDWTEAIASQHAEVRINAEMEKETRQQLADANRSFAEALSDLRKNQIVLQELRFASTCEVLQLRALVGNSPTAGAWPKPPELTGKSAISVRLHESSVNHAAQATLTGKLIKTDDLAGPGGALRPLLRLGGSVQPREPKQDGEPNWVITMAKEQPLTIQFIDNGFVLKLRVERFDAGKVKYDGREITAQYRFVTDQGAPRAVLAKPLTVARLVPKEGKKTIQEMGEDRSIANKFTSVFGKEIPFPERTLPGEFRKAGPLTVSQVSAGNGWLLVSWNRKNP